MPSSSRFFSAFSRILQGHSVSGGGLQQRETPWHRRGQVLFNVKEKKGTQPCSRQPVFTAWRRNGRTVKNSSRSQGPNELVKNLGRWGKRHMGGHDMVRRMDWQGDVLIWCRKCSGYARRRMGHKLCECIDPLDDTRDARWISLVSITMKHAVLIRGVM